MIGLYGLECEIKCRSFSLFAFYPDIASVLNNEFLAKHEAHAGALLICRTPCTAAEWLENFGQVFLLYSYPVIFYTEYRIARFQRSIYTYRNGAVNIGELY